MDFKGLKIGILPCDRDELKGFFHLLFMFFSKKNASVQSSLLNVKKCDCRRGRL